MKSHWLLILFSTMVVASFLAGCSNNIPVTGADCCTAPEAVIQARDAAIAHVQGTFGIDALKTSLAWQEQHLPTLNSTGSAIYEYTGGDWIISVAYPTLRWGAREYTVTIVNASEAFTWAGAVDESGAVLTP